MLSWYETNHLTTLRYDPSHYTTTHVLLPRYQETFLPHYETKPPFCLMYSWVWTCIYNCYLLIIIYIYYMSYSRITNNELIQSILFTGLIGHISLSFIRQQKGLIYTTSIHIYLSVNTLYILTNNMFFEKHSTQHNQPQILSVSFLLQSLCLLVWSRYESFPWQKLQHQQNRVTQEKRKRRKLLH